MQHDAGIEMHHAFGAEAERLLADRDVAGIAAVEILVDRFRNPRADPGAQRLADVDVLARDAKRHGPPPVAVATTPRLARLYDSDYAYRLTNRTDRCQRTR